MPDCPQCGRSYGGHHNWCTKTVKAIILDRGESIDDIPPKYAVRRSALEHALSEANPLPSHYQRQQVKPSRFNDNDREYDPRHRQEGLWEYPYNPDMDQFDYQAQTNTSSRRRPGNPRYSQSTDVGYGRIMANEQKQFRGFSRHPTTNRQALDRSPEIRESRIPGLEKVVRFNKQENGKPRTVNYGRIGHIERNPGRYI